MVFFPVAMVVGLGAAGFTDPALVRFTGYGAAIVLAFSMLALMSSPANAASRHHSAGGGRWHRRACGSGASAGIAPLQPLHATSSALHPAFQRLPRHQWGYAGCQCAFRGTPVWLGASGSGGGSIRDRPRPQPGTLKVAVSGRSLGCTARRALVSNAVSRSNSGARPCGRCHWQHANPLGLAGHSWSVRPTRVCSIVRGTLSRQVESDWLDFRLPHGMHDAHDGRFPLHGSRVGCPHLCRDVCLVFS